MRKVGCGTMSRLVEKKAALLSVLGPITEELYPYSIFLVKIQFLKPILLIVNLARSFKYPVQLVQLYIIASWVVLRKVTCFCHFIAVR